MDGHGRPSLTEQQYEAAERIPPNGVPATLSDSEATVSTSWGAARLEVEDVRAQLRMPIGMIPWWLFALLWTHASEAWAH